MLSLYGLSCVSNYVEALMLIMKEKKSSLALTNTQKIWLKFCLSMIILTNSINWDKFERFSLKAYKAKALGFIFHHAKINWSFLFICGIILLLKLYGVSKGHLIVDDTDRPRSKVISKIAFVFKSFNKKTGGYFNCQNLVFLLLVTDKITIPVGFKFYTPCPKLTEWAKKDKEARKLRKTDKSIVRPTKPERSSNHPKRTEISKELIQNFTNNFKEVSIISCSFDAAYGFDSHLRAVQTVLPKALIVSEMACNTKVTDKRRTASVKNYFNSIGAQKTKLKIRGGTIKDVEIKHARLYVESHKRVLNIIALRYEGEENFRFIITPNLSWRAIDVVQIFTFRWLVEVFFYDWKCYEGFGQAAIQQSYDGGLCGVLLSLLVDQCLLFHPEQIRRISSQLSACTVGSLREKLVVEFHLEQIKCLLLSENPQEKLKAYSENMDICFAYRDSTKHMSGREFPDLKPCPTLLKKFPLRA